MQGFGWIETEEKGKLFVHKNDFLQHFVDGQEPMLGTRLSYVHGYDPKNPAKERATAVQVEGQGPAPATAISNGDGGERRRGSVQTWDSHKACGWVDCLDEPGKKYFAHKSEFAQQFPDSHQPRPGAPLTFLVGFDPKSGKERATNISMNQGNAAFVPAGYSDFGGVAYGCQGAIYGGQGVAYGGQSVAYGGQGVAYGGKGVTHVGGPHNGGMFGMGVATSNMRGM